MVIRGNSRSNPKQLAHYLLAQQDNEAIRILDVDGRLDPKPDDLHKAVFAMGISAELSKSEKGLYHAQINPAPGEDKLMDDETWGQAADILAKQLGLDEQRRVIVLHTKKGRTHAHVVWERYSHEQGKMVSDSFSRLAQDRARTEMEEVFNQKSTPHRNKHRPELKAALTQLWEKTDNGAAFVQEARKAGYLIAAGSGRDPFTVVDENARSYNLARQIKGARIKDIRARLRYEPLVGEKEAITIARNAMKDAGSQERGGTGTQKATYGQFQSVSAMNFNYTYTPASSDTPQPAQPANDNLAAKDRNEAMKEKMAENGRDAVQKDTPQPASDQARYQEKASSFATNRDEAVTPAKRDSSAQKTVKTFAANREEVSPKQPRETSKEKQADNRQDVTSQQPGKTIRDEFRENMAPQEHTEQGSGTSDKGIDPRRAAFMKRMAEMEEQRQRGRDKGLEMD